MQGSESWWRARGRGQLKRTGQSQRTDFTQHHVTNKVSCVRHTLFLLYHTAFILIGSFLPAPLTPSSSSSVQEAAAAVTTPTAAAMSRGSAG